MFILSCDPGLSGGFCLAEMADKTISIKSAKFFAFPAIGSEPNFQALTAFFLSLPKEGVEGIIEKVGARPGQGVSSMFKFGRVYGIAQAYFAMHGISTREVTPQSWQKEAFQGVPEILKATGKKDNKKMSLLAASRLYPNIETKKDWQSDSLLIADYYRRQVFSDVTNKVIVPIIKDLPVYA